jgi:hypothetical protein
MLSVLAFTLLIAGARADNRARSSQADVVRGDFQLLAMVHSTDTQDENRLIESPWNGVNRGNFRYRSRPCTANAPVNNLSSNLPSYNGRVAGSRLPASTRLQPLSFSVLRTKKGKPVLGGTADIVVCQLASGPTANPDPIPDAQKPRIRISFRAPYTRHSSESTSYGGTFKILSGTGRYEDLTGSGTIQGNFFCLGSRRCDQRGGAQFDGQLTLQGTYRDPTPQL